jgi:leucyl/phenylalanyl-tRNA---protein transferase
MEFLDAATRIRFPDPESANPWGVVAQGGNLSPGVLLSAYEQGIFPWYEEDPILWFSPDPRFVLYLDEFHLGRRLARTVRSADWTVTFDGDFEAVITACREPRGGMRGTWITDDMVRGYSLLHELECGHSVEVWRDSQLVGGLYGVSVGNIFSGESMFTRESNAGKVALIALVGLLDRFAVPLIDCQSYTRHLASFGAREVRRSRFLRELEGLVRWVDGSGIPHDWTDFDPAEMLRRGLHRGRINSESRCPR